MPIKKPIALLKDSNYARGMNDVDDPSALADGYCAELVNAYPGFPLEMRKGISFSVGLEGQSVIESISFNGKVFIWVAIGYSAKLYWIDETLRMSQVYFSYSNTKTMVSCRELYDSKDVISFEIVGNVLYSRIKSNSFKWGYDILAHPAMGSNYDECNMIAIEFVKENVDGKDIEVPYARVIPASVTALPADAFPKSWVSSDGGSGIQVNVEADKILGAYGFSVTLVRRTDTESGDVFMPGSIESPEGRLTPGRESGIAYAYLSNSYAYPFYDIKFKWKNTRKFFGFTHLRIYRTRNFAGLYADNTFTEAQRLDIIKGATRYFLVDVPIDDEKYTWSTNGPEVADYDDLIARIEVSDGKLIGEANTLQSAGYNFPPADGYLMKHHKNRMFILGEKGQVYFSEVPGGDGGTDLESANLFPEKYALWYSLYSRYELGTRDGVAVTGIASFDDDLYFFKSNKIWCLIGGMPPATPRVIADGIGSRGGGVITAARVDNRPALFFLSAAAPMLIEAGGYVREFTAFKCKELWGANESLTTKAVFWDGKILVFAGGYMRSDGSHAPGVICGYSTDDEYSGAFKIRMPDFQPVIRNDSAAVLSDGGICFFCAKTAPSGNRIAFGGFGDSYIDTTESESFGVPVSIRSRRHLPGPLDRNMAELLKVTVYCTFNEGVSPFIVEIESNRFKAKRDYNDADPKNREYVNNQTPKGKRYMRTNIALVPESDFMGERFQYEITKKAEADFRMYGAEMEAILRPNVNSDDLAGGDPNKEIWAGDA